MERDLDLSLSGESQKEVAVDLNRRYYLQSDQRRFPMPLVCIDGVLAKLSILSEGLPFSS
jgi:hypothetical protein